MLLRKTQMHGPIPRKHSTTISNTKPYINGLDLRFRIIWVHTNFQIYARCKLPYLVPSPNPTSKVLQIRGMLNLPPPPPKHPMTFLSLSFYILLGHAQNCIARFCQFTTQIYLFLFLYFFHTNFEPNIERVCEIIIIHAIFFLN